MENKLLENRFLQQIGGNFKRAPRQLNQFLESDAELLALGDGSTLAITTDCISEEISTGLYHDPDHIGWMTVVVNLSDLAAVGAEPLGLLLSESLPADLPESKRVALQNGIARACEAIGTYVLGGDTNLSGCWQMGGTAVGILAAGEKCITRKGAQPGDLLYTSGPLGLGSAYAFSILFGAGGPVAYWPVPRLKEGKIVRQWGSCCIDTSDGFFHAMGNIMEVNGVGFQLEAAFSSFIHPEGLRISKTSNLPSWIFLAGPHGEFELLFTLPAAHEAAFIAAAAAIGWSPIRLGVCIATETCVLPAKNGEEIQISPATIANAFTEAEGNPQAFLNKLLKLESLWQIQQKVS